MVVVSLLKSFRVGNCFDLSLLLFLLFILLEKSFNIGLFLMVDNDDDDSLGDFDVNDGEGDDGSKFDCIVDGIGLVDEDCTAFKWLHKYPVSLTRLI
jgi:hypothetical protein